MPFIGKASVAGNSKVDKYITTVGNGGQTNFPCIIDGGDEYGVYLNGILLKETDDYTATSTQIALEDPAIEDDIFELHVFRSFFIADAVKASGDTMTGTLTIADGANNLTIASHDGSSNGLVLGSTLVTASGDDMNKLATTGKSIAMSIVFG